MKKYHLNAFQHEKHFEKQFQLHFQTGYKTRIKNKKIHLEFTQIKKLKQFYFNFKKIYIKKIKSSFYKIFKPNPIQVLYQSTSIQYVLIRKKANNPIQSNLSRDSKLRIVIYQVMSCLVVSS
jgi:hypothetical protein